MRFFFLSALLCACSGTSPSTDDAGADASPSDASTNDVSQPQDAGTMITFSYTPQWSGVNAVSVYGGFGQSSDWTSPLVTLADDGTGTWKGQATLPNGVYLYVFKIVGDAQAGANAAKLTRYAIDPADSAFAPCPAQSPTYDAQNPNPCSQLTIPQPSAPAMVHVTGLVVSDGQPIASWLVQLDREEKSSHHFFVNRVTTKADGAFDLVAAPGSYRVQVLHPTFLSASDAQLDPVKLASLRRDLSSAFPIASGTVPVPSAEIAFHTYASFNPVGDGGALPTTFAFDTNGAPARLDVYGTGMDGGSPEIGDPWFASPITTSGGATFDGGFNTPQANQKSVAIGERYFWGVEESLSTDAGVTWTAQSMVFDVTWH